MLGMAGNERCNGAIPLPDLTEMQEEILALASLGTDDALEALREWQEKNNEPDSKVTDAVSTSIKSFKALSENN